MLTKLSLSLWCFLWSSMSKPWQIVVLTVLFAALSFTDSSAAASPSEHRYNVRDRVPLFVNKVGPLNNPRYPFPPIPTPRIHISSLFPMHFQIFLSNTNVLIHCYSPAVRPTTSMTCRSAAQVSLFSFTLY